MAQALARREDALARWHAEQTTAYRLLHGAVEGAPGLAVDRYGPVLLVQSWREPPADARLRDWHAQACDAVGVSLTLVWNHRAKPVDFRRWFPDPTFEDPPELLELGLRYDAQPRHRGQDPLLFLDLRAVRRRVRAYAEGRSVLNLFAYTCGVGLAAAAGGASEVLNVDFAATALQVGRDNALRNDVSVQDFLKEDCLAVMRQFAAMKIGRRGRVPRFTPLPARTFDLVVLDPPRWSTSPFGAVDVVRDYPSLFKPCIRMVPPGGVVVATNHVASVDRDAWLDTLRRCATKAGRPLTDVEWITPEADFPSPDGRPPLKVAWCHVG